eukprot:24879_5
MNSVFLQFAGTTTTGIILGEPAHWITDNSSFTAFFLAYWMVFCSPNDTWFRLLKQGAVLVPMKALETVRYGVLISTLGLV